MIGYNSQEYKANGFIPTGLTDLLNRLDKRNPNLLDMLGPDVLSYRELWRLYRWVWRGTESRRFSAALNEALGSSGVVRVRSRYAPYNKRKICWLLNEGLHEKLSGEFGGEDYGKFLDFTRFSRIKHLRKTMHKHLVGEFCSAARKLGLGVRQHEIEFIDKGALIRQRYWELRVPRAGRFVLAFRQFNCRLVYKCDLFEELWVCRAIFAEGIACRRTGLVTADRIRPEDRHPEVLPTTRGVRICVVAPETDVGYLRRHAGVRAFYVSVPRYVPGFKDSRSNYRGQVTTRRRLYLGIIEGLRKLIRALFKMFYRGKRDKYVLYMIQRHGIRFEPEVKSLADLLPDRLPKPNSDRIPVPKPVRPP